MSDDVAGRVVAARGVVQARRHLDGLELLLGRTRAT
jgi:hypothetical protein